MQDRSASKNKPITLDTVLSFGQYKGATIEWVVENDPSYILWLDEEGVLKIPDDIVEQAEMYDMDEDWDEADSSWGWDGFEDD